MFRLTADWEKLDEGTPEEIVCFAALQIELNHVVISQGHDPFVRRVRNAPLLSTYHLAEWLTWNWWRLRWEPRSRDEHWRFAHGMSTIGEGYVWPTLTIFPDGERVTVASRQSMSTADFAFRYLNDFIGAVPALEFERGLERFVAQVLGQLEAEGFRETNLQRLWCELDKERRNPELAAYRRIEAILAHDPDEGPKDIIERLLADGPLIGLEGVTELAAAISRNDTPIYATDLSNIAEGIGTPADLRNAIKVQNLAPTSRGTTPAWLAGQRAAQAIRQNIGNDNEPLDNRKLASLIDVNPGVLDPEAGVQPLSFSLRNDGHRAKIVLRSKWETGRRFDLARILGDVVASGHNDPLVVATRSSTYRQKLQRAFAAELLCPFQAIEDKLQGDYSDDQQEEVAAHFQVSPLTIRTLLVNHCRLEWDEIAAGRNYKGSFDHVDAA